MQRFYEGLVSKKLAPAAALQFAQLSMSRTEKAWQSPYYWAGFVIQGRYRISRYRR
jgi:CHAT domain-containing protein